MNLDELRAKDIPEGSRVKAERLEAIDPLAFFVGRVSLNISEQGGNSEIANLSLFIDRNGQKVRSATGELTWDYGRGVVTINAPKGQGAVGFLKQAGRIELGDVALEIDAEYASVLVVALDDLPLRTSRRMLVQVVTEESNNGWQTKLQDGLLQIVSLGGSPLLVRDCFGRILFRRPDAKSLRVTALDANGYPTKIVADASRLSLLSGTLYYLVGE
ncbi:MAG: hypothetical protein KEFWMYNX_002082 [Candidatus Fervidibacter sp.]